MVHEDDLELVTSERLASLLQTRQHKTFLRLIGDDAIVRTILCSASLVDHFDKKHPHFSGTMIDVSEDVKIRHHIFLSQFHATQEHFLENMERFTCGLIAIDGRADVLRVNRAARKILSEGPLFLRDRCLRIETRDDNLRLVRFLRDIVQQPHRKPVGMHPIGFRRVGRRPLVIQARFLEGPLFEGANGIKAVLGLIDLDASGAPPAEHIRGALGLTVAESRLALVLMDHFKLRDAAETLSISHETARTQLRSIFIKTGARTQADLLVLLERLGRGVSKLMDHTGDMEPPPL